MKRTKRTRRNQTAQCKNQFAGNALFIVTICLIMILSIFMSFSVSHVSAQENTRTATEQIDNTSNHKYYKSIEIQRGDTLWDIAKDTITSEYSSVAEYIKVLKEINGLESDEIQAGRMLIVEVEYDN